MTLDDLAREYGDEALEGISDDAVSISVTQRPADPNITVVIEWYDAERLPHLRTFHPILGWLAW